MFNSKRNNESPIKRLNRSNIDNNKIKFQQNLEVVARCILDDEGFLDQQSIDKERLRLKSFFEDLNEIEERNEGTKFKGVHSFLESAWNDLAEFKNYPQLKNIIRQGAKLHK